MVKKKKKRASPRQLWLIIEADGGWIAVKTFKMAKEVATEEDDTIAGPYTLTERVRNQ